MLQRRTEDDCSEDDHGYHIDEACHEGGIDHGLAIDDGLRTVVVQSIRSLDTVTHHTCLLSSANCYSIDIILIIISIIIIIIDNIIQFTNQHMVYKEIPLSAIHSFIHPSIHTFIHLSTHQPIHPSIHSSDHTMMKGPTNFFTYLLSYPRND